MCAYVYVCRYVGFGGRDVLMCAGAREWRAKGVVSIEVLSRSLNDQITVRCAKFPDGSFEVVLVWEMIFVGGKGGLAGAFPC
jgi:hypothetical protein